jgi:hypothetical protein
MVESFEPWAVKTLVDLEEGLQFNIISDLPLLLIFVVINNLILFTSDPFLEIVNIGGVMEEIKLLFGGLFALEHGKVVAEFVALDE